MPYFASVLFSTQKWYQWISQTRSCSRITVGMTPREKSIIAANALPDRLKAARKAAGLTQDQLVALAELAPVTLSKLETGVNRPTFEVLVALAAALDVTPNFLAGWDEAVDDEIDAHRRQLLNRLLLGASSADTEWLELLTAFVERLKMERG